MLLVKGLPSGMTARVAPVMALWMHTGAGNWEGKYGGFNGEDLIIGCIDVKLVKGICGDMTTRVALDEADFFTFKFKS